MSQQRTASIRDRVQARIRLLLRILSIVSVVFGLAPAATRADDAPQRPIHSQLSAADAVRSVPPADLFGELFADWSARLGKITPEYAREAGHARVAYLASQLDK